MFPTNSLNGNNNVSLEDLAKFIANIELSESEKIMALMEIYRQTDPKAQERILNIMKTEKLTPEQVMQLLNESLDTSNSAKRISKIQDPDEK